MSYKLYLSFFCIIISVVQLRAQQDSEFTQFMNNRIYYNPAYSGVEGFANASIITKRKWVGYKTSYDGSSVAPTTEMVSFNTPIYRFNSGFGAVLLNDKIGLHNSLLLQTSFAYHIGIKGGKLSFGINAGFKSQSIDFNKYSPNDINDPLFIDGKETNVIPDMGLGIHYQSEVFFISLSSAHLIKTKLSSNFDSLRNVLNNTNNLMAGYYYEYNRDLKIIPAVLVQTNKHATTFDFSILAEYEEKFSGGFSYKFQEAVAVILNMKVLKNEAMNIGYSFDFVINNRDLKQGNSHEIQLSYTLKERQHISKPKAGSPRFKKTPATPVEEPKEGSPRYRGR